MSTPAEVRRIWRGFLRRSKPIYIGGEIVHYEVPEGFFRGPITDIIFDNRGLKITTLWTARCATNVQGMPIERWKKRSPGPEVISYDVGNDEFPFLSVPQVLSRNEVRFTIPFSSIVLYPRTAKILDRSSVDWSAIFSYNIKPQSK